LYLSFEAEGCYAFEDYEGEVWSALVEPEVQFQSLSLAQPATFQFADNRFDMNAQIYTVQDDISVEADSTGIACDAAAPNYIYPSNVLAFWNEGFNNTNLATREFERRMHAIHETCDNAALKVYTSNIDKSLKECDDQLVAMGHYEFQQFAAENVGKMKAGNPHVKQLQRFYEKSIRQLKKRNGTLQEQESDRRSKHDEKTQKSRKDEAKRTRWREQQAYQEEYNYNLQNVYNQLGYTRGFTITSASRGFNNVANSAVKNIDRKVATATVNQTTRTFQDATTGRTAEITYNDFSFSVENADQYIKLFAYLMPYELNSYKRISGKNGAFFHPLNNDILYNIAVVGVKEDSYAFFKKMNINAGNFGKVSLKTVSKRKLDADVKQLNSGRNVSPVRIDAELNWLAQERKDYKEKKMRKEMLIFRNEIRTIIFPCCGDCLDEFGSDEPAEGEEGETENNPE